MLAPFVHLDPAATRWLLLDPAADVYLLLDPLARGPKRPMAVRVRPVDATCEIAAVDPIATMIAADATAELLPVDPTVRVRCLP